MPNALNQALEFLKSGKMVILVDDEDRENEGDLVLAAEFVTPEAINFMATHARGLICLTLTSSRVQELGLPMMTVRNQSPRQTAFTVSIEAKSGVSTGISAQDRARTIAVAIDPSSQPDDLIYPGHIFPLRAKDGGVLVRAGHTEGSVDLARLAGLQPSAVICEIMNEDGTMARMADLRHFAQKHDLPIVSIKEVIARRVQSEHLIQEVAVSQLPSSFSETPFEMHAFKDVIDGSEHLALVKGPIQNPALVRVHSECLTGDALGSLRCDCGNQLQAALKQIGAAESGVLVYMRRHEGRGIGLVNKVKAYALQDQGMDTVEANQHLGFQADLRHYGLGAQILRHLGVKELKLLTNNPKKIVALEGYGLSIVEQVPLEVPSNPFNQKYLSTKKEKMGHHLQLQSLPSNESRSNKP
jgi:3,4-dihydroxy 2-butanone 4-phosphate synthase/GTP cyclohydrolase II